MISHLATIDGDPCQLANAAYSTGTYLIGSDGKNLERNKMGWAKEIIKKMVLEEKCLNDNDKMKGLKIKIWKMRIKELKNQNKIRKAIGKKGHCEKKW